MFNSLLLNVQTENVLYYFLKNHLYNMFFVRSHLFFIDLWMIDIIWQKHLGPARQNKHLPELTMNIYQAKQHILGLTSMPMNNIHLYEEH